MLALSITALALALAPAQTVPTAGSAGSLPPSLKVSGIERCNPTSIDNAVNCLTSNLDTDDQQDLARNNGMKYRSAMVALMTSAWKLADPEAPLSKEMAKRGIYYPDSAAVVLMTIMDTKIQGGRVDYKRLSNELKATARPASVAAPVSKSAEPTSTPVSPGNAPSMEGAVPVPVEQCKRPNALPGEVVVTCMKLPNGGLVATRRIPNPAKAPN